MKKKLFYLLPFIAGLNGISFRFANLNIRLDQLLAVILLIFLAFDLLIGGKKLFIDLPGKFLILFFVISFLSSYLYSPDSHYSIIQTINIISVASVYFIIHAYLTDKKTEGKFLKSFVYAGIIMCGLGIFFFVFANLGIINYGVNLIDDPATTPYGVYGTMYEPNIFGSYSVIYFIYSLNIILLKDFGLESKRTFLYLLFFSAAGVFLSFTRGAWLAAIIAILLSLILIRRRYKQKHVFKNFSKYLITAGLLLSLFLGFIISKGFLLYKIDNFLNSSSGTGYGRLEIWSVALDDINNHLLLGNGTYSFAAIYAKTFYSPSTNAWIGNFILTVIHDTGIIGAIVLLLFLGTLILRSIRGAINKSLNLNANSFSLAMACIAMLIAFFFTTGFSFCYAWIPLGVISYFNKKINHNYT